MCRDCKVQICGKNFRPEWVLFNGAIGVVQEIVFGKDKNPNDGDQPKYVTVKFDHYEGPTWDKTRPNVRQPAQLENTA